MNGLIEKAILEGRAILFLGAGASIGSENQQGLSPPLGSELAKLIAQKVGWEYSGESLSTVYSAAKGALGDFELRRFLESLYSGVRPSPAYVNISRFPWARIYTINIDDAMESALFKHSPQRVFVRSRNDQLEDRDQLFGRLDYVYLNGSIKRPDAGFVFSPEEYGQASATNPRWYEEAANDFGQFTFIFIGTKLDEPVFHHHVERYKQRSGLTSPNSYLIIPKASPIEIEGFKNSGLEFVAGSTESFSEWLTEKFPTPPKPIDIAQNRLPELRALLMKSPGVERERFATLMQGVELVSRHDLSTGIPHPVGTIRSFYKGFKPTWRDLIDDIPAQLQQYQKLFEEIETGLTAGARLLPIVGPAGSGKSTFLRWAALRLADSGLRVYYLDKGVQDFVELARELERVNRGETSVLVVERLDPVREYIVAALARSPKVVIIGAESQNVWANRVAPELSGSTEKLLKMGEISENDVSPILSKVQRYGPWTRLSNMTETNRKDELFVRSRRQLLIGLMEATTGIGFEEIISRDFQSIGSQADRLFFTVCCLATMHRSDLSQSVASRALNHLGATEAPIAVAARMEGLIQVRKDRLVARHPVYARKIIESVVDQKTIFDAATALLQSFSGYRHPVVKSLNAEDSSLFKTLFNHRFVKSVLRDSQADVLCFYSQFEKLFEKDGLFWLQYGLAIRSYGLHLQAFELLQTAHSAFPHEHTKHALAQQKMILAASDLVDAERAKAYLAEAIELLQQLDDTLESDDTYPVVTLAEGHVRALRKLSGTALARVKAQEYVRELDRRLLKATNARLQEARKILFAFAATGAWKDEGKLVH